MPKISTGEPKRRTSRGRSLQGAGETAAAPGAVHPTSAPVTSLVIFELCIQRARNLLKLHEAAHGRAGKPQKYASDAHRAAIVLAVAALDAFVRDFIVIRMRAILATRDRGLPAALAAHIKKFLKEDDLLEAARKDDLLARVEKAVRADFEKRAFQGTKNIEEQFRIIGYDNIFHEVAIEAHLNEDSLRADLNKFTSRRHTIAHKGDYDLTTNPPAEQQIKKKDAEDCIKLVCTIATRMHDLRPST